MTEPRPEEPQAAADAKARSLVTAVASALAIALAGGPAWAHTFPPQRSVVVQVEDCELAVMIGYRPGTGEPTQAILGRIANQPKSRALDALKDVMGSIAVAPIAVEVDGTPLVPTSVRAKIGVEDGGARPIVVVLVTYALPSGHALTVLSKDPRSTRISWQDRSHGRVDPKAAPAQDRWHEAVASFLLSLAPSQCARSPSSD
jgi:hypothetical protein